jgi:radical SAM protein with 4Fe4S-binding SPASM domain
VPAEAIAEKFSAMMLSAISNVMTITEQQANLISVVSHWIYLIDALDDYDKDTQKKRFNPFRGDCFNFDSFVAQNWRKISIVLNNAMNKYVFFNEEIFDYYSAEVILNEFMPEVTYNVLMRRRNGLSIFKLKTKGIAFANEKIPYNGLKLTVELPNHDKDIVKKIIDALLVISSYWNDKVRIRFVSLISPSKSVKFIRKVVSEVESKLKPEIRADIDYTLEIVKTLDVYADEFVDAVSFESWLFDKTATHSEKFINLARNFLLGYCNTCSFSSCLGRNFLIDVEGKIYACEKKYNSIEDFDDFTTNSAMKELLTTSINRRDNCKSFCEVFEHCGGNCPAKEKNTLSSHLCPFGVFADNLRKCKQTFQTALDVHSLDSFNEHITVVIKEYISFHRLEGVLCNG